MSRSFDAVVVGGDPDGLVAATVLARSGSKVLLVEAGNELGGVFREIEFAPGFRAAPLAADAGFVAPQILSATGLSHPAAASSNDASVVGLGSEGPLELHRDLARTARGLQEFSRRDADRWPAFCAQVSQISGFLAELYGREPPRIDASGFSEWMGLASLGLKFRKLGKAGMVELMHTLPMPAADWLDDWFESDRLKGLLAALAVADVGQGPMSGGTAFTFLHRHVGAASGVFGERSLLKEGPKSFVSALAQQARAAGVVIETGASVERLIVRDDRIVGARLASSEEVAAPSVLSSLNPHRTLFELLDPVHLDPEFMQAVNNIRYRGVATKVLLALDGLPSGATAATHVIAPSIRYVERAYDAVKYRRCSEQPIVELRFPSLTQSDLAPSGKHVGVLHVQFTPYGVGDSVAERAIALVDQHLPGLSSRIVGRAVLGPGELEARFGLREGALSQGEMMLDQILFMRPVAGASRYAMPVPGLYLCGASTHPGNGITGMSGLLAARAVKASNALR
jgi:phytoene dehydrogenase-like protein